MQARKRRGNSAALICLLFATACETQPSSAGYSVPSAPRADLVEDTIITTPRAQFAGLGRGRDLVTEELRDTCITSTGALMDYSHAHSILYLDEAMTREQITTALDTSLKGEGLLGVASAETTFKRTTEENAYSLVVVYGIDYVIGGRMLDPGTRRMLANPETTPNWYARCGDHFLMQTDTGGQLFVAARLEFDTAQMKTEFKQTLGGKFGWGSVSASLSSNRSRFSSHATIHVGAFQKGGNVAALGQIIGSAGGIECGLSKVEEVAKCSEAMKNVLAYAGSSELIQGMHATPADLRYYWVSWRTVLDNAPAGRDVPPDIAAAREPLRTSFDAQLSLQNRLLAVKTGVLAGQLQATNHFKAELPRLESTIQRNLEVVSSAAKRCFEDLDDPNDSVLRAACLDGATPAALSASGFDGSVTLESLEPMAGQVMWVVSSTGRSFRFLPGDFLPEEAAGHDHRVGDFNGDGLADVLFSYADASGWHNSVALSRGSASPLFWSGDWLPGVGQGATITLGDFNGDEKTDLLFAWRDGITHAWRNAMYLNTGGSFRYDSAWLADGVGEGTNYHSGDFNGDDLGDVLFAWWDSTGTWHNIVFLSNGQGFDCVGDWPFAGASNAEYHVGDFNGDGASDVLMSWKDVLTGVVHNTMRLSTRSGFGSAGQWLADGTGTGVKWRLGDFNGDGATDVLFGWDDRGLWRNTVLLSNGFSLLSAGDWLTGAGVGVDYLVGRFDTTRGDDIGFIMIPW